MKDVFACVCASALSATWFALAVIVLRSVFRKAPKWIVCALWGIVALRLVFPVTFETGIGIAPDSRKITENIIGSYSQEEQTAPSIGDKTPGHAVTPGNSSDPSPVQVPDVAAHLTEETPVPGMAGEISPGVEEKDPRTPSRGGVTPVLTEEDVGTKVDLASVLSAVWLAGAGVMLVYALVSYVLLKKRVATSTRLREKIYQSENVGSPFILGVFRPKIYLPYATDGRDLEYVVAHERAHIKRMDHLWKPIGFLLLALFWFDPVLWLAFALFCRDVEGACDEKVIGTLDEPSRKEYSAALLSFSAKRFSISACPVAFGETGVRERVKRVLNYKKPAFWVIILLVVASAGAGVLLLTTRTGGNTVRRADVQKLEYGMKMSEVLGILGESKGDVGSGAIVLEWDVEGGETLRVTFNPPVGRTSDATVETQNWVAEVIRMTTSFKDLINDLERKAAELDAADFDSAVATVVKDYGIYEVHRSEIESDLLLFQYGTYDMRDGKGERFVLNITRQFFLKGEDEPYQFAIDRFYDAEPFSDVGDFTLWSDECSSVREFENRIKNSPGYKKAPEHEPTGREVYFDDENGSRSWSYVRPETGTDDKTAETYPEIGDVPAEKSSMIVLDYYDCNHAPQFKDTEKVKVTLTFNVPYDWHKETETSNWFVAKLGYYDFEVVVMDSFRPFRVEKDYVLGKDILSITQRKTSTLEEDIDPDKYEDRLSFGKTKSGYEYILFEMQREAEYSGKKWTEYDSKLFFRASDEIVVEIVFRDDTSGNAAVYKIIDSMEAKVILEPIPEDTRQIETDRADETAAAPATDVPDTPATVQPEVPDNGGTTQPDVPDNAETAQIDRPEEGADNEPTEVPSDVSLFRYSVENGCAIITGLTDDSVTEAVVPSEIDGCPVTEIGSLAFAFSGDLGRVVLPKTVRKIGEGAFYGCSSLVNVNIPYGVSEIGTTAFKNCVSLKSVIIPSSVTRIEGETFIHCESLESVSLSGSLKIIGERAFAFCGSLKKLTVPGSVETIEGNAFYKCSALSEISLPDTAIEMGGAVFLDTAWEKSQPEGLIYIGKILYGYRGTCPENVSVRPGTVCIAGTAFSGVSILKSITIPSSVKYIGNRAFYMCSSISEATVHASLLEAYPNCFAGYPDLKLTVVS